jgi:murein DD-endopeptidase MepM/ murein hydrolase activator NlpD
LPLVRGGRILELSLWTGRKSLRLTAIASFLLLAALATACGGGDDNSDPGVIIETVAPVQTETPAANGGAELHGFAFPIGSGCLPSGDQLMPNATRAYRNGTHEGVDFYGVDNCTAIGSGTPVLAAKAGTVIRADAIYTSPTAEQMNAHLADPNTDAALDFFRGQQVWIDHGGGIVTRYAHLGGIETGILPGVVVQQGQLIAYVGESGTPESVNNPGSAYHLHFEVRLPGGTYLGQDEAPETVRSLYQTLFTP